MTVQDLQAEARAQRRPYLPELAPTLAEAVIDRLLMARKARELSLDHTPDFPSDKRRADAQVLADQVARRLPPDPPPTQSQILAYETAHPEAFSDRQRLALKMLAFPADIALDMTGPETLARLHSKLQSLGIPASESLKVVESDDLPPALLRALQSAPEGTAVVWQTAENTLAMERVSAEADPVSTDAATAKAGAAIEASQRRDKLRKSLTEMMQIWPVHYAPGFRPPSERTDQLNGELR